MPLTEKQIKETFGAFAYRENSKQKGAILIDSRWVGLNITAISNPLKPGSKLSCHKKVAYQMERFLAEGVKAGLIQTIDGIFVARHKMWNPARSLSGHSWGVEVDVNAQIGKDGKGGTWNYGANSYQPLALIELASKWGLEWGGSWKYPDGMHFSVVKVIEPGGVKAAPKPPVADTFEITITARGKFDSFKDAVVKRSGFKLYVDEDTNKLVANGTKESLEKIAEAVLYYRGTYCVRQIS